MPRLVTLGTMLQDLEYRCDIERDLSFLEGEKRRLLNLGLAAFYDDLVAAAPPDYYLTEAPPIETLAGQIAYQLPADFYKVRRVQVDESSGRRRSLYTMQPDERIMLQPPIDLQTVRLEYIPVCPELDDDGETFDGVNGWEELPVLWAAIKVYRKKGLDPSSLAAELADARARVVNMAYRDAGTPPTMSRISLRNLRWPWTANTLTHYRIRGRDTLELYRMDTLAPYP